MARVFDEAETREIIDRYAAGESVQQIGSALARSAGGVHRLLCRNGVVMRSNGGRVRRPITERERRIAVERYGSGLNIPAIARELGRGVANVTDALLEANVALRKRGGPPKLSEEKRSAILEAWHEGKSATAIATELRAGAGTVKSVLANSGEAWENRVGRGPNSAAWRGGRIYYGPTVKGARYIAVWVAGDDPLRVMASRYGYVPEHRLVMARSLGRPLMKHETVHHVSGDREDNRLDNLQLRNGRHGKGVVLICHDCGSHNIRTAPLAG